MPDVNDRYQVVALLRRKPGMSPDEFQQHWRDVHAPLAAAMPGLVGLTLRHITSGAEVTGLEPFGVDGIALVEYESREAMERTYETEAGKRSVANLPNFCSEHAVAAYIDTMVLPRDR